MNAPVGLGLGKSSGKLMGLNKVSQEINMKFKTKQIEINFCEKCGLGSYEPHQLTSPIV